MLIIRGLSAPEFSSEDDGRASAIPWATCAGCVLRRLFAKGGGYVRPISLQDQ